MRFLFLLVASTVWAAPLSVELESKQALLINADTGAVLYEKDAHRRADPASIIKVATTLYALQKLPLDQVVTIQKDAVQLITKGGAVYHLHHDASNMKLLLGDRATVSDLVKGTILASACDGANALAEAVSGTIPKFMEELQEYLQGLGCRETRFITPSGLPAPDQYTTAHDLAVLAQAAFAHPFLREAFRLSEYVKPAMGKSASEKFFTSNYLIRPDKPFYDPRVIGGKTGHSTRAKFSLVVAAEKGERRLIAVLLQSTKEGRFRDATRLFDAAFSQEKVSKSYFSAGTLFLRSIEGKTVEAALMKDLELSFYPAEAPEVRAVIEWRISSLPVKKGGEVGELLLLDAKERVQARAPLVAKEGVSLSWWEQIISFF
jgi:D-alanyl-D-alanine carboxypeptidase (penicillin-binding protein 5/6)